MSSWAEIGSGATQRCPESTNRWDTCGGFGMGKQSSGRVYLDPSEALEAVGLSEQDAHAEPS